MLARVCLERVCVCGWHNAGRVVGVQKSYDVVIVHMDAVIGEDWEKDVVGKKAFESGEAVVDIMMLASDVKEQVIVRLQ